MNFFSGKQAITFLLLLHLNDNLRYSLNFCPRCGSSVSSSRNIFFSPWLAVSDIIVIAHAYQCYLKGEKKSSVCVWVRQRERNREIQSEVQTHTDTKMETEIEGTHRHALSSMQMHLWEKKKILIWLQLSPSELLQQYSSVTGCGCDHFCISWGWHGLFIDFRVANDCMK